MSDVGRRFLYLVVWIIASGVATILLTRFWRRWLIPFVRRRRSGLEVRLIEAADGPVQWTALAAGLYMGAQMAFPAVSMSQVSTYPAWRFFVGVLYVDLILAATVLVYSLMTGTADWYAEVFAQRTDTRINKHAISVLKRLAQLFFFLVSLTIVFQHFGVEITGILATAGIASLAFAFAAQDSLSNLISGVILMIDHPFRPGDRITLPSGEMGDVIEIGLRSTKVMSFDQTVIVIPNAEIAKSTIVNHNAPDAKIKVRHRLGVAYGSDIRKVKTVILDILRQHPQILQEPAPAVFFTEFGESSLILVIVFWLGDYRQRLDVVDAVNLSIQDRFAAAGIEIPFPQRDIHIRSGRLGSAGG